ncbi:MAG: NAD(P)H-dependent oxidoreductase subunit E [Clostridiales bacterium]|nr:NAD(P)H-dependent oxidoreductase subunit E [Clostridiales bacterium]
MKEKIKEIAERYPPERRFALAIMQDIQHEYGYIPEEAFPLIKGHIGGSVGNLYAIATFYKALSLEPKGKHIIRICDGTACHMRGAANLAGEIERHTGVRPGECSDDGHFSVESVNCLGSCALAPVIVIDGTYYGNVAMESLPGILDAYRQGGELDG